MIEAIHTSGVSTLFVRLFTGGQWANLDAGVLEAWNGANVADYALALAEAGDSGLYVAAIPAWLPVGTYTVTLYDSDLGSNPIGSGTLYWDGAKELTPLVLQAHGDVAWTGTSVVVAAPVHAAYAGNKIEERDLECVQFSRLGPFDIPLFGADRQTPLNLEGHDLVFVVSSEEQPSITLWQVDCTVSGPDFNVVTIQDDDTHTQQRGRYVWILRDRTNDAAYVGGKLTIKPYGDWE